MRDRLARLTSIDATAESVSDGPARYDGTQHAHLRGLAVKAEPREQHAQHRQMHLVAGDAGLAAAAL